MSTSLSKAEVVTDPNVSARVQYGAARLRDAMKEAGVPDSARVNIGTFEHPGAIGGWGGAKPKPEGFVMQSQTDGAINIMGGDDSGAFYGSLELARRIKEAKQFPANVNVMDAPVMKLRGPCIGMQKTFILPGRKVYEYPYTPELFPFFYDKALWTEYLDFLADNRFNSLYLWNGQPFASLVRVEGYEDAQEVDDATFAKNQEMMRWLSAECDRRGIWLVQMFYSIILPKPLAEKNNLPTQLKEPVPVAQDYTRKAIAQFVKDYPNVSLMPCLGEALQGMDNQKRWLIDTILGGIHDGMKEAGLTEEPPVLVRTHATDLRQIMPEALQVYENLYTEAKFNGESLTTWEPRGKRQQVHLAMSQLGSTHMINVHILANLEPFRYGAQRFIQKCVQAGRDRLGAKGVHLYPLFYWNWPDSPDKVAGPPLKQIERDWIWFEAWARYAWNPDIPEAEDHAYWIGRLSDKYGSKEAAEKILDAYNDAGECAPRILRRFGITEGNRQTMSLGMYLDQLVHPEKYREFEELWESQSPPGERLKEYVARELKDQPHEGETPPQICKEVLDFSQKALDEIDAAAQYVTKNKDEYERLRNDVHCIRAMSQNYAAKATAAIHVLKFEQNHDVAEMEQASKFLAESLEHYHKLAELTKDTYAAANSMQTSQRMVPTRGGDRDNKPAMYHWTQMLPNYEQELEDFNKRLADLKGGQVAKVDESTLKPLPPAKVKVLSAGAEAYEVKVGATVFTDRNYKIESIAPELVGLTGIRFSHDTAKAGKYTPVEFETDQPVYVLIGYVKADRTFWLKVPNLETDALAAERGGIEPSIQNAATISEIPPIDVHALQFGAGRQKLEVRGTGSFVVLGIVPQSTQIAKRDAGRAGGAQ